MSHHPTWPALTSGFLPDRQACAGVRQHPSGHDARGHVPRPPSGPRRGMARTPEWPRGQVFPRRPGLVKKSRLVDADAMGHGSGVGIMRHYHLRIRSPSGELHQQRELCSPAKLEGASTRKCAVCSGFPEKARYVSSGNGQGRFAACRQRCFLPPCE